MSTAIGPVSSSRRSFTSLPVSVWVPLAGMVWVFLNVLFLGLAIRDLSRPSPMFSVLAGGIDGGILGFIFVATLSEKIHAGTAGLLGGYGFQDVLNNFKLTGQCARWIHAQLDPILDALLGFGNEPLHEAIQRELVWVGCSAAFVVLATLIVQLIRTVGIKPVEGR